MKPSKPHPYPRPDDYPGTERDWYYHLLSIELDIGPGGMIGFDPISGPEVLQANEEALLAQPPPVSPKSQSAKSRSEQLARHILNQKPKVAKQILKNAGELD